MMESKNSMQQSLMSYLRQRVIPILEPLQFDILIHKPADIHDFSYIWLQSYQEDKKRIQSISSEDQQPDQEFMERLKKKARRYKGRKGISGEVFSTVKTNQSFKTTHFSKCENQRIKILIALRKFVFFKNVSQNSIEQIIECMKSRQYHSGDIVIKQGQIGNQLFLVDTGIFKCHIDDTQNQVRLYEEGDVFGELALLYNTNRASTITAVTDGKLFILDRLSFNTILRDNVLKRARLCEQILNKNEIFANMQSYEKCKLIENLKEMSVGAGKYIIREGQIGDRFYIVGKGSLVAEKVQQDNEVKSVYYYKEGDYFGQISLIRNVPRQASIKSLTTSKLFFIERSTFKRLLGPLQEILKRNEQKYRNFKNSVRNMIL